jgi:hypothetical protein
MVWKIKLLGQKLHIYFEKSARKSAFLLENKLKSIILIGMKLTFYSREDFSNLGEDEQLKEIFFLYGFCFSRIASADDFFIKKLKFNKYEFEGNQLGKTYTKEEWEKIEFHYDSATTGTLLNEFRKVYDTTKFDDLFTELKRIRDLFAHRYMRLNWQALTNKDAREDLYDDLLYPRDFLLEFAQKLANQSFFTRANPAFAIRWKGGSSF